MSLVFVDVEGHGPAPGHNDDRAFEFGAVDYQTRLTFHGRGATRETFLTFEEWLKNYPGQRSKHLVFVSDNPAYDWQFINYYFHEFLGRNPFGHSARKISDFFAGLTRDWRNTQAWKNWRRTPHDHNPVNDAMGNVEAFDEMCKQHHINIDLVSKGSEG